MQMVQGHKGTKAEGRREKELYGVGVIAHA
jgi:hypothetical protein